MQPRLSHSAYKRLLDFIAALQEPVSSNEFGRRLLAITAPLFPGAIISFDQIHSASGQYLFDHTCPLDETGTARMIARLEQVYTQNPIYDYIQNGGTGPVVRLSDLATRKALHRTDFYQDIFRPFGIEHQVSVLVPRNGWITTLTINRDRDIPRHLTDILHMASRHIALAHRAIHQGEAKRQMLDKIPSSILTARENEVFHWLQEGKRNAEIAKILGCSPRTIDKHVEHILRKTAAETRTAAVRGTIVKGT